jgi:hypothetical protein
MDRLHKEATEMVAYNKPGLVPHKKLVIQPQTWPTQTGYYLTPAKKAPLA